MYKKAIRCIEKVVSESLVTGKGWWGQLEALDLNFLRRLLRVWGKR